MNRSDEQLNGWKEIACHLQRSVRCVQRWERNEGLPVRRHGHMRGASVYAFREELNAWWENESHRSEQYREGRVIPAGRKSVGGSDAEGLLGMPREDDTSRYSPVPPEIEQTAWAVAVLFLKLLESARVQELSDTRVHYAEVSRSHSAAEKSF